MSLLFLLIVLIIFFYKQSKVIETKIYPIKFNITENKVGLNIEESLFFGNVRRSTQGIKQINISNNKNYPIEIYNRVIGEVAPFIMVEPYLIIPEKTITVINVTVISTNESSLGHYEGELIMKAYRGKK